METVVTKLTCEYFENPLGIDVPQPRLSWQLHNTRRGVYQVAYQIIVESMGAVIWDTGKVDSDQSTHIPYEGPALTSGQRVVWKVRVWDESGHASPYSDLAWWEMGLVDRKDWKASWIGSPVVGAPRSMIASPFLRKPIQLKKMVSSARLYSTALGLYEFQINGQVVGEDVFRPGWTDYKKRVYYQTYDVTSLLSPGDNVLGAILGDGWYCGHIAWRDRQFYGDRPKLLAQLAVVYVDGTSEVFTTDASWKTATGPILEADLLMGESYDARQELPGWSKTEYDDSGWVPVMGFPDPGISLDARCGEPLRRIQELTPIADPVEVKEWPVSCWIFDLGQNMTGNVRLKVSGPAGTNIRLRYAEVLDEKGRMYTANLRSARVTDYYTLKGEGIEIYEPRFTFHGFRYVEVRGLPESSATTIEWTGDDPQEKSNPARDTITGIVIHSNTLPIGSFECSDPLLNQLQHNIIWGQKGNFFEVPTDCPQRDERLGWTGDAQVFIRTAAFNMNVAAFFTKWLVDMDDAQSALGQIPSVVPNVDLGRDGGPAWADAALVCPWTIYLCYGDKRILEKHYDTCKRYLDYLERTSPGLIRIHPKSDYKEGLYEGYGDWLSINAETPKDLIGTAMFAYSARLMEKIARVLGRWEDSALYGNLYERVRAAFINRFVTGDGLVAGLTQTSYILALQFDLLPEELRPRAVEELVRDIAKRNNHLSAGFVGSSYLPFALSQNGRLDVAYQLLNQKSWPSWLYAVTKGATTIWERWDGWTEEKGFQTPEMNSFNHYAYGAIGSWLYSVAAGIELDPERPGYKHILFRPAPGGGLTHAKASVDSPYGKVISDWHIVDGCFEWDILVPPNTTATVYLPGEDEGQDVVAGGHHFTKKIG
jgi:alpha-L-rhamnosidase